MTTATPLAPAPSKALHIALWVVTVLLTVAFLASGFSKVATPAAQLTNMMAWTTAVPLGLVRFIGVMEVLGALGLILPSVTRIRPALTPLAASGLVIVMVLAVIFHLTRGEIGNAVPALVLALLAAFVAWGRRRAPIAARA
ncbi:DoxX family protein [Deinococcus sp. UYEF24]